MLFKAVLFAVMLYLVACYAYGIYLLWKLWTGRRAAQQTAALPASEGPRTRGAVSAPAASGYGTPAKAA
jgi:hypothetical protein